MAFDFLDMFPDSQAAVAGSQGARDILENQNKQAMGFLDMENALMRTVQARKQLEQQRVMEPLAKTVEAVKLLQSLNMESGDAFRGIDLNDPNAMDQALKGAVSSGQLMTDVEANVAKARAAATEMNARTAVLEGGRNARDAAEKRAESEKQIRKEAFDRVDELNKRYPKTPTSETKLRSLYSDYQSLKAYGVTEAARVFFNKHSAFLSSQGETAPGSAPRSAKPQAQSAPNPPQKPMTYTSKSGKNYIIHPDGKIEQR